MTSKNRGFAADLASSIAPLVSADARDARPSRMAIGVLSGRGNRLADLASGAVMTRTHELVDPARCRMWSGHNRDYPLLNETRCADLIESMKAQGKQEVPAIVRRITDDEGFDFEVVCGARRHWSITWLREHNYPDFKFLVEVREMGDEEAFRVSDLENRARDDLSDVERARDYRRALDQYYGGHQGEMAERLRVSQSWLSRYLDLARLPDELMAAFSSVTDLKIKHVTQLKPLLKPDLSRKRVLAEAIAIGNERADGGREGGLSSMTVQETIRRLARAAAAPRKSGPPKRSGRAVEVVSGASGKPLIRLSEARSDRLTITVLLHSGASREEAKAAVGELLERYWTRMLG